MAETDDQQIFDSVATSFKLLLGAKQGSLQPPVEAEIQLPGKLAEAMGSARHMHEEIEDAGYEVEHEHVEELEPAFDKPQHLFRFEVTEE